MKLKHLQMALEEVDVFEEPKIELEQCMIFFTHVQL
jgi:predicted RNA methylase